MSVAAQACSLVVLASRCVFSSAVFLCPSLYREGPEKVTPELELMTGVDSVNNAFTPSRRQVQHAAVAVCCHTLG